MAEAEDFSSGATRFSLSLTVPDCKYLESSHSEKGKLSAASHSRIGGK